ncbi:BTAD domain-containing putative transcriptional regulator [Pseudonocardia xinjiangensis]|uniref:AfsR/SARP family transcriptional regulator n=1 Tax=Pseudonocardia xinjiangensis TaxID=75289 RepID=UPI003D8E5645
MTSTEVSFRILGPLEVVDGGRPVPVPQGKQRVVLAALLLRANRTVSIAELTEQLWDGPTHHGAPPDAPHDSRGTVQKHVMRLRQALAGTGVHIRTEPDGYRIELGPGQLDLDRSDALVHQGRRAAQLGDDLGASAALAGALQLWRAVPPLTDVASPALHRNEVPPLVERYLQALELRIDVDLRLGRHAELAEELIGLVRSHPLRERFWAQWMRALYATGRQGEALEAYREVTRLLADELGIDPGPELRAAHEQILRGTGPPDAPPPAAVLHDIRQLPVAPTGLVGRQHAIRQLTDLLGAAEDASAARLVVVAGPPGVGKSAVAVHAAHRLADRFPDGQLFADLGGHGDTPPQPPEETLARFLRALGMPPEGVPPRLDDAVAAYRSVTAGRRLLVVLDNANSPAQVRTLLPGASTCGVVVTSRHELAGLLVSPGGHRISLDLLDPGDARLLLHGIVGDERMAREPEAAAELIALCGGLPLALRVAAAHLVTRPHLPVAAYVEQLRSDGPVATLRIPGDRQLGVAAALEASYVQLTVEQRHLLRLLGLVPDDRITPEAGAVLVEQPVAVAAAGLDQLAEAGLLQRRPGGGYRLHGLTRAFALLRQAQEDDPAEIHAARRRLPEAGEHPRGGLPRTALRRPTARRA